MMTEEQLPQCDPEVFSSGKNACQVDIPKHTAELICKSLTAVTGVKIDWHYVGGWVVIKALTQIGDVTNMVEPASPALKLPDAKPDHDSEDGNDIDYLEPSRVYALGVDDGFNRCLREVVKLNAPHTAPIEPICVTGNAEWVKVSERMPGDSRYCVVSMEYGYFLQCWGSEQGWVGDEISIPNCDVTHWMPLPTPPAT